MIDSFPWVFNCLFCFYNLLSSHFVFTYTSFSQRQLCFLIVVFHFGSCSFSIASFRCLSFRFSLRLLRRPQHTTQAFYVCLYGKGRKGKLADHKNPNALDPSNNLNNTLKLILFVCVWSRFVLFRFTSTEVDIVSFYTGCFHFVFFVVSFRFT